jgi:hypothetical protein
MSAEDVDTFAAALDTATTAVAVAHPVSSPATSAAHKSRRQSIQTGLQLLHSMAERPTGPLSSDSSSRSSNHSTLGTAHEDRANPNTARELGLGDADGLADNTSTVSELHLPASAVVAPYSRSRSVSHISDSEQSRSGTDENDSEHASDDGDNHSDEDDELDSEQSDLSDRDNEVPEEQHTAPNYRAAPKLVALDETAHLHPAECPTVADSVQEFVHEDSLNESSDGDSAWTGGDDSEEGSQTSEDDKPDAVVADVTQPLCEAGLHNSAPEMAEHSGSSDQSSSDDGSDSEMLSGNMDAASTVLRDGEPHPTAAAPGRGRHYSMSDSSLDLSDEDLSSEEGTVATPAQQQSEPQQPGPQQPPCEDDCSEDYDLLSSISSEDAELTPTLLPPQNATELKQVTANEGMGAGQGAELSPLAQQLGTAETAEASGTAMARTNAARASAAPASVRNRASGTRSSIAAVGTSGGVKPVRNSVRRSVAVPSATTAGVTAATARMQSPLRATTITTVKK